jgi:transcriptional regulator with XRE-family HTH domain
LETLVSARKEASVTQVELGERLGRRQTFVSSFERGDRRLDVIEFYAIAKALGYEPEKLFARLAKQLPPHVEI